MGVVGQHDDSRLRLVQGRTRQDGDPRQQVATVIAAAGAVAVLGMIVLDAGYERSVWLPAGLLVLAGLVAALLVRPLEVTRAGAVAVAGSMFLLLWASLSMTWADGVDRAWTESNRLILYVGLLVLALATARTRGCAHTVMGLFAMAAAIVGVTIVARMLAGDGAMFFDFRLHDPLGYTNGIAGLFLMGLWALLGYAPGGDRPALRAAALAGATLLACLLVLTQSRAIVPAVLLSAVVLIGLLPDRQRRAWALVVVLAGTAAALPSLLDVYDDRFDDRGLLPQDATMRSAAVATIAASLAAGVVWGIVTAAHRRLRDATRARAARVGVVLLAAVAIAAVGGGLAAVGGSPADEVRAGWDEFRSLEVDTQATARFGAGGGYRYDLWRIAWKQLEDNPLLGVGAGNYNTTYFLERRTPEFVRQPHSLELQALAELGLPGGLALLVVVGAVAVAALRRRRERDGALHAAIGVCVVWLVHTSVDWLHLLPGLTGIAIFGAALVLVRPATSTDSRWLDRSPRVRRLALGAALVVVAVLAASLGRQYGALLYRERAQDAVAARPAAAVRDATRALALNRFDVQAWIVLAAAQARQDRYFDARDALQQAAAAEPFNYVPWALLGDLAVRRGDMRQAGEDYARANALNPLGPPLRVPPP